MLQTKIIFGILFLMLCHDCLKGSEASRHEYLLLLEKYPHIVTPQGCSAKGEIEIITDAEQMRLIEGATGRDVGVIAGDKYWIWINDACRFPSGQESVYGRILGTNSLEGPVGVAVMPIMPDGRIALICTFRHATRSWEFELPRGFVEPGESKEEAAKRETLEETGMLVSDLSLLGEFPPDTGISGTLIPVFAAKVIKTEKLQPETTEAIEAVFLFTFDEIKQAFKDGFCVRTIRDERRVINFRDPFLTYALLLYELK